MSKIVVVLGATGLVGSALVDVLLSDNRISEIRILSRRPLAYANEKIKCYETDLAHPTALAFDNANALYCCIGTTRKKTPKLEEYRSIDQGMTIAAALAAKNAGVQEVHLISAIGADSRSKLFYNRLKGEIELDLLALNFDRTLIYQPALLIGERQEKRTGEKFAQWISPFLDKLLNKKVMKYHSIKARDLASGMLEHSFQSGNFHIRLHYPEFLKQ